MRLVNYKSGETIRFGVVEGDRILALPEPYATDSAFLAGGEHALAAARQALSSGNAESVALASVELLAPILRPGKILCIGLNYRDHAAESKMAMPEVPTVFIKLPNSVTGPGAPIILPKLSKQPDYEAELAVVIGRAGRNIAQRDWQDHVLGYTILNDVSARDIQLATSQWLLGKSFDSFAPMGPWIVTKDEIPDPHTLDISLAIDGEVLQHSNTRHLIFPIPQLIEYISAIVPIEPGDIISTGTPAGVGLGRTPQRWLRSGEEIVIDVERIGQLRNRTVAQAG